MAVKENQSSVSFLRRPDVNPSLYYSLCPVLLVCVFLQNSRYLGSLERSCVTMVPAGQQAQAAVEIKTCRPELAAQILAAADGGAFGCQDIPPAWFSMKRQEIKVLN